jgi:hypothetical protein
MTSSASVKLLRSSCGSSPEGGLSTKEGINTKVTHSLVDIDSALCASYILNPYQTPWVLTPPPSGVALAPTQPAHRLGIVWRRAQGEATHSVSSRHSGSHLHPLCWKIFNAVLSRTRACMWGRATCLDAQSCPPALTLPGHLHRPRPFYPRLARSSSPLALHVALAFYQVTRERDVSKRQARRKVFSARLYFGALRSRHRAPGPVSASWACSLASGTKWGRM